MELNVKTAIKQNIKKELHKNSVEPLSGDTIDVYIELMKQDPSTLQHQYDLIGPTVALISFSEIRNADDIQILYTGPVADTDNLREIPLGHYITVKYEHKPNILYVYDTFNPHNYKPENRILTGYANQFVENRYPTNISQRLNLKL